MFIHSLILKNFKCFTEKTPPILFEVPDGATPGSGLNILVGENNSGKSTVFEALNFVRDGLGKGKDMSRVRHHGLPDTEEVSAELVFTGDISAIIDAFAQENKQEAIQKYLFEQNGKSALRICRSSKKEKELALWNDKEQKYRNEAGIDAPIKKLFELDAVWADTNPNDEMKFGATTVCGRLMKAIIETFKDTEQFQEFKTAFNKAFNDDSSTLRQHLKAVESRTQKVFESQFGQAKISFRFDEPEADSFFKATRIKVDDGIETFVEDKGSGMQRSVALALLQVYAEELVKHPKRPETKPFFLIIDEPEICLHPQAQTRLLWALMEISKTKQLFVSTHSPYFIEPRLIKNIRRFQITADREVEIKRVENEQLQQQIITKENRSFFFRHRDLFFTDRAFFVEGIDDVERYRHFCEESGFEDVSSYMFQMNGCGPTFFFEELCTALGISFSALVDKDFSYHRSYWSSRERRECLSKLKELCAEKNIPGDWDQVDTMINADLIDRPAGGRKSTIPIDVDGTSIQRVTDSCIYVLQSGEVKDYLTNDGTVVADEAAAKRSELTAILSAVRKDLKLVPPRVDELEAATA